MGWGEIGLDRDLEDFCGNDSGFRSAGLILPIALL